MPAGPVILNNTPLVALWAIGRLGLLRDLFAQVLIPQAVRDEFLAVDSETRGETLSASPWIRTVPLSDPRRALPYAGLDQGEAEVLALAEELTAGLLVIDERRARRYAERLDLPLTGTLGLLLLARERGLIGSVLEEIDRLKEAGLYLSPALVARTREIAGE